VEVDVKSDEAVAGTTDTKLEEAVVKASGSFPDNPFSSGLLVVISSELNECVGRRR
jgi:hypothetical protein